MIQFAVGNRVKLKSGSVEMVVYAVTPDWVCVSWKDDGSVLFAKIVDVALALVDERDDYLYREPFPLDEFRGSD